MTGYEETKKIVDALRLSLHRATVPVYHQQACRYLLARRCRRGEWMGLRRLYRTEAECICRTFGKRVRITGLIRHVADSVLTEENGSQKLFTTNEDGQKKRRTDGDRIV